MGEVSSAIAAIRAGLAELAAAPIDGLTHRELIAMLDDLKELTWILPAHEQRALARLMAETEPKTLGAKSWNEVLRIALRVAKNDAARRVRDAAMLGERRALSGASMPPHWEHVAAAQARGHIGAGHIAAISEFFDALPHWVDIGTRAAAEAQLAQAAAELDPDQLRAAAKRLLITIDPDGAVPDEKEQNRKRGLHLGRQQPDGMSKLTGYLTPAARSYWEAAAAKLAAPGASRPDQQIGAAGFGTEQPDTGDATTTPDAPAGRDDRSPAQRDHDAFLALCRETLSSGTLGTHNGLPVTVIVTTTLQDLEHAARTAAAGCDTEHCGAAQPSETSRRRPAGHALTAGGTLLPMREVIRMAIGGFPYLAVFDKHTNEALYLARAKRLANPAQRLMLIARDQGCTRPGCTTPGYWTQAHHAVTDWNHGGHTNIDELTLACGPDNRAATTGGWTTRKRPDGRTEWLPPPALDTGQARVNNYHHPQNYLLPDEADEDAEDGP
ncbi:MAG: DUF222 domain-containing protein [Actinomycetota bacterium]|nr:DUF222 domain-containing protein [Actinomycetota bacterium]